MVQHQPTYTWRTAAQLTPEYGNRINKPLLQVANKSNLLININSISDGKALLPFRSTSRPLGKGSEKYIKKHNLLPICINHVGHLSMHLVYSNSLGMHLVILTTEIIEPEHHKSIHFISLVLKAMLRLKNPRFFFSKLCFQIQSIILLPNSC